MEASDYTFKTTKRRHHWHTNVYKILISAIEKSILQKILEYPNRSFVPGKPILDNFGILFIARNQASTLCVQPIGSASKQISTMKCKKADSESIVQLFRDLHSVPILWRVVSPEHMHIEISNYKHIDFSKLVYYSNPFERLDKLSVYQHLFQSVFRQANASLHYHSNAINYGATLELFFIEHTLLHWDTITRHVIFKFHGYQFMSCHSETYISFEFYVAPFQPLVWGMFISSVVIVALVLSLYKKLKNINSYEAFSPWSFVLANIFEEAVYVPMHLEKQQFFRMVVGGWILMSVVLTNCYNGLMISSLNSPLPRTNIPETFQDLICQDKSILKSYKLGVNLTNWILQRIDESPVKPFDSMCYKILSTQVILLFSQYIFEFLKLFHHTLSRIMYLRIDILVALSQSLTPPQLMDDISMQDIVILLLSKGYNSVVPENFNSSPPAEITLTNMAQIITSVTDEVAMCGRSVLIVDAFEMGFMFADMTKRYFWRKFYKGKDILNFALGGWKFEGEGNSKVPQYFESLFESGIQGRLELEMMMRKYSRNSNYAIPKREDDSVRLRGAILTLFILWGALISLSVLIVIFELRKIICLMVLAVSLKIKHVVIVYGQNFWRTRSQLLKVGEKS
ncbi:hypothetical protein Fcan01_15918 [Folsomia candida]|uniref:Uncharacterized protein n=1 Tax=Folsomia candida TaxID=158441 RepID=A0A226DXL3_FOLCA|nr:hypothetical protein Fcan01_15918 [Folsomia candida]